MRGWRLSSKEKSSDPSPQNTTRNKGVAPIRRAQGKKDFSLNKLVSTKVVHIGILEPLRGTLQLLLQNETRSPQSCQAHRIQSAGPKFDLFCYRKALQMTNWGFSICHLHGLAFEMTRGHEPLGRGTWKPVRNTTMALLLPEVWDSSIALGRNRTGILWFPLQIGSLPYHGCSFVQERPSSFTLAKMGCQKYQKVGQRKRKPKIIN